MLFSRIVLLALLCGLGAPSVVAKRVAPKEVTPVVRGGVGSSAPLGVEKLGIVQARDAATRKLLWEQKIYEIEMDPDLEEDLQWVFISNLEMKEGKLIVTDKRERHYSLDLETRKVRPLGDAEAAVAPAGPVEVVKGFVVTDQQGESRDDLRVLMYLRNTQDEPLKLLTRNLQVELFGYNDRPKELRITLSAQKVIDGAKVIPSEHDLSPVVLAKGEVAEIRIAYRDRKDLTEVVLVYDMRNDVARRYQAWSGQVRGPVVKVTKFEPKR